MSENRVMEDVSKNARQARYDEFVADFGVDPSAAEIMFRESSPFKQMVEHMYYDAMDALRESEDIATEGKGIQGQAQLLWKLMSIPERLNELKDIDI